MRKVEIAIESCCDEDAANRCPYFFAGYGDDDGGFVCLHPQNRGKKIEFDDYEDFPECCPLKEVA